MSSPSARFTRLLLIALCTLVLPAAVFAQDNVDVQPQVDNSRFEFAGQVNSDDVSVRSGPGEAYYATMKLNTGAKVTVVGIKFDWLKILPPDGSFCYVSKLYVERFGDGTVGRVTKPDIRIRAGSTLNPMKTTVLTTLDLDQQVHIIGEEDEYYKITPPQGAYLYVNKQFIDPIGAITSNAAAGNSSSDGTPQPAQQIADQTPASPQLAGGSATTQPEQQITDAGATTQPVAAGNATTQPADEAAALQNQFDALESDFNAATALPLEQQPDAALKTRYQAIRAEPGLSDELKSTVDFRLAVLNVRIEAQRRLASVKQMEADDAKKAMVLTAEQQELQQRLASEKMDVYAAVGQLQPSSLQSGTGTLYRLIDPASGHTVVYLRSGDPKTANFIGQFVGVRGELVTDSQLDLKVIPFTDIAVVDPAQVNGKVQAEFIPPSMMVHSAQASTDSPQ
ncbi:MAG TPA: hypothetical protein VMD30_05440 [Tepidisphaeraceae bacterium]|nr:hypothetical protein [Tepidisphaeraceae bacterium]